MQFLTAAQCQAWLREPQRGDDGYPTFEGGDRFVYQGRLDSTFACGYALSGLFADEEECLLWVAQRGIWSENLQLYYRFRESYGDRRLLEDAPGHLFLPYEKPDLLSYLQIAILNGWDVWILGSEDRARLDVSHDEFFIASVRDETELAPLYRLEKEA